MPRAKSKSANASLTGVLPEAPSKGWFAAFAQEAGRLAGKPGTFLLAFSLIVFWALSGPAFGFSDTWQLMINTTTTIVTFLMVFLIQTTQNRDQLALQAKLAEIVLAMPKIPDSIADAEDMSDEELEKLHDKLRKRAQRRVRGDRKKRR